MSGNMSRNKGQRGEREVVKLLQPIINRVYGSRAVEPPQLERNLMQSHKGGFDIVGLEWMALEVKYQESANLNGWWKQTLDQARVDESGNPRVSKRAELRESVGVGGVRVGGTVGMGPDQMLMPILLYRSNHQPWRCRMFGGLFVGGLRVRCAVNIAIEPFLKWFELKITDVLDKRLAVISEAEKRRWSDNNLKGI